MADEESKETIKEEESIKEQKNEVSDETGDAESEFYGEDKEYKTLSEIDDSLASDFCAAAEYVGEEYGEGEWICREIKSDEDYYEEQFSRLGEYLGEEEREAPNLKERRSLDSEYLKSVLGTPLTHALLDIASLRPTDPIQYLGHYLLRWRWCGEKKDEYERIVQELTAERNAYKERMNEKERQEMLTKEQVAEELRRAEKVESESSGESDYGESNVFIDD